MTHTPVPDNTSQPAAAAHVEDALDEALEESFPASDPIAISSGEPASDTTGKGQKA